MMVAGEGARAFRMAAALAWVMGSVLTAGCGGGDPPRSGADAPDGAATVGEESALAPDEGRADEAREDEARAEDGLADRELSADVKEGVATAEVATAEFEEPELRTYRLLLVNRGAAHAVVHASAGAGRVVLDTVRGRDSARVNVEVRAERLLLEAEAVDGDPLGSEEIEPSTEEVSRWVVPVAGG